MSERDPLRVAVVGVGHLGRHHARILSALEGASLVAVVDVNRERAEQVASSLGVRALGNVTELEGRVDAVTVAVPTDAHVAVALPLVRQGVAVLVEKPLARSSPEADSLIAAAESSGATLAVGHTERYNPAVVAATPFVRDPRFIEVHRLGTFPDRSLDIDVVFDLMIHDIDIVLSLVGPEVEAIEAVGVPVLTDRIDIANARLRFASGCIANLTASRISRERVRKIRFFQHDAYISIDYGAQDLEVYRLVRGGEGRPTIGGGKVPVDHEEPLKREMADFLAAVRDGRPPLVTADDGRRAVALARRIADRMAPG